MCKAELPACRANFKNRLFLKLALQFLTFLANSKKCYEICADYRSFIKMRLHFDKPSVILVKAGIFYIKMEKFSI